MMLRRAVLALPLLSLFGCMDRPIATGPDGARGDLSPLSVTHVVQNLDDFGPGSLREAIAIAGNGHVITFAPALSGGTIVLSFELFIDKSLTIAGPEGGITLSGNHQTRIFRIANVHEVVFDNLTLTEGNSSPNPFPQAGGAILNSGNLTIRNSTVTDSWAEFVGGAIDQQGGSLTLVNSTISRSGVNPVTNQITTFGGGIRMFQATVTLVNSTVSGNTASNDGGAIFNNQGTLTLIHSTITDNGAARAGGIANGGTVNRSAVTHLVNSIVARNSAAGVASGPDIQNFSIGSPDPEEFVELSASHSLVGSAVGHQLTSAGNNLIGVDPGFELDGFGKPKLADNGGPTQTHALLASSPAIDVADSAVCTAEPVNGRDQRGAVRPQGTGCDMGSFEAAGAAPPPPPPPTVSQLSINASGGVTRASGVAILSGTIACSTPGIVQVRVELSQQQKQRSISVTVTGSSTLSVNCGASSAWAAAVTGSNGIFLNGAAQASAEALDAAPPVTTSRSVQLFWNK